MRFVRLNQEPAQSPYTIILKNGCGPNFVFNRVAAFEKMIREQGLTFWFRVWLKFCLNPGCNDLKAIQEQWPDIKSYANINIHEQFLHGSVDDAIKFCLETALARLKVSEEKGNEDLNLSKKSFYTLLQECSEMAFGASLCEVFYNWLMSKETTKSCPNYWSVPKLYFNPEFKPGLLENFIMKRWGTNLLLLLGVNQAKHIPWISEWPKNQGKITPDNVARTEHPLLRQNIAEVLKTHREQRRLEVDVADELPNAPKEYLTFNMFNEAPPKEMKMESPSNPKLTPNKVQVIAKTLHRTRHQCARCGNVELVRNAYKKCKRCVNENWLEPRYYCCSNCEMEHWFQKHQKDHLLMEKEADVDLNSNN